MLCFSLAQELWLKRWKRMIVVRADFISLPLCFFFFSLLISCLPSPLRSCWCACVRLFEACNILISTNWLWKNRTKKKGASNKKTFLLGCFFSAVPVIWNENACSIYSGRRKKSQQKSDSVEAHSRHPTLHTMRTVCGWSFKFKYVDCSMSLKLYWWNAAQQWQKRAKKEKEQERAKCLHAQHRAV